MQSAVSLRIARDGDSLDHTSNSDSIKEDKDSLHSNTPPGSDGKRSERQLALLVIVARKPSILIEFLWIWECRFPAVDGVVLGANNGLSEGE